MGLQMIPSHKAKDRRLSRLIVTAHPRPPLSPLLGVLRLVLCCLRFVSGVLVSALAGPVSDMMLIWPFFSLEELLNCWVDGKAVSLRKVYDDIKESTLLNDRQAGHRLRIAILPSCKCKTSQLARSGKAKSSELKLIGNTQISKGRCDMT